MKNYRALLCHRLFIFVRLLLVSVNANALADSSSLQHQFRVDTTIELAKFHDREIIEFKFVKGEWELDFDSINYTFQTISDVLQLQTNIVETDPVDSFVLTLVDKQSQCFDNKGIETLTKDFSNLLLDGKKMNIGDTFINEKLDELNEKGKYRTLDVDLSFEALNYGDDSCSGFVQMSVELEI